MRERLVIAFVGLTVAVIGLYGIPRAYFLADLVRDQETATLTSTANSLAALVRERTSNDGDVDELLLESGLAGVDRVDYTAADGRAIAVGDRIGTGTDDDLVESRILPDGSTLRLTVSGDTVGNGIQEALMPLVLLGLLLAAASAVLGLVLARRLSRPFQDLAVHSRDLGHGRFDLEVPSYAVPEADAIGASLRGAAAQLDELLRREREFAANASHQLRTPITALRLSLEDLTLWPETAPEVRTELELGLGALDRLNGAIDELLALARGRRLGTQRDVDLTALVTAAAERWSRQLAEDGRQLVVAASSPVPARVATGPVEQVLDVLIENARVHGRGTITIDTRDAGTHLEVTVADGGERRIGPEVFQRGVTSRSAGRDEHGIGLAVASELAEMCGGHLSLDLEAPHTCFVLWLPLPDTGTETDTGTGVSR